MRSLLSLVLAALLLAFPSIPAQALSESGSHGWARTNLVLSNGPGPEYDVIGQIAEDAAIKVLRCQRNWCLVDGPGGRGWTGQASVDFGRDPAGPILDPDSTYADLRDGTMCFYEGTNFTGRSFCASTGEVFLDLATWGWDNRISSIRVVTGTSAAICRDREFQSYCERIVESQPALDPLLRRNLSSIRIY